MRYFGFLLHWLGFSLALTAQTTPFELSTGNVSATHAQAVAFYQRLAAAHPEAELLTMGPTDVGKPLHLFLLSKDQVFDPLAIKAQGKAFLLINNGIHPGEPCGIDACLMLARDLLTEGRLPADVVIGIVPVYNIGGALNRGRDSRANQDGPEAHGFRGNARNFDLNRDFVKMDTRNARSFAQIFHRYLPDLFVDTHTTNGADYQPVLTLIETQPTQLQPPLRQLMTEELTPALFAHMDGTDYLMSRYVNVFGRTPDDGFARFLDGPRYSTGYAALFQTPSYVTEAHMLKPFAQRVRATYAFLDGMITWADGHAVPLTQAVQQARLRAAQDSAAAIAWELDTTQVDSLTFDGYAAQYEPSQLTGQPRLRYDRSQPWTKRIPYYDVYQPTETVAKPTAYLIPQSYEDVIERLRLNGLRLHYLERDTLLTVEVDYLNDVQSLPYPYEGHHFHRSLTVQKDTQQVAFYAGDVVVFTGQWRDPYLLHVLEPLAQDAFFRWNFFDGVLMQKEYFSSYVFEETALNLLEQDPALRDAFQARKEADPDFAQNARAQLDFIYRRSPYYEPTHRRYPVARWKGEALALRMSVVIGQGKLVYPAAPVFRSAQ